jgi:hypothetical protein
MRELRARHNWLFTLGLTLALVTSVFAPMLHGFVAFETPWQPGDVEAYDLRPEARTLSGYHLGHWSAAVAGFMGVLLLLAAASGMEWYEGVPLALLAVALGYWNTMPITGDTMW